MVYGSFYALTGESANVRYILCILIMRKQVTIIMTVYIMKGKVKACVLSVLTIHTSKDEPAAESREVLAVTRCTSTPIGLYQLDRTDDNNKSQ